MAQPLLTQNEIENNLKTLDGWTLNGDRIEKTLTLQDFGRAMGFVTSVALLAERRDHHPDITIRWNTVTLVLSTHSAGGLTAQDFALAREIDGLRA